MSAANGAHVTLELDTYCRSGHFLGRFTYGKVLADNIGSRIQNYLDTLDEGESLIIDVTPWREPDEYDPAPEGGWK